MRRLSILTVLALGIAVMAVQPVLAFDPVITFGFSDLSGQFTQQSMLFTAVNDADSDGDVTRADVDPDDTARFEGLDGLAGFFVALSVDSTRGDTITSESGSFVITDLDGDVIQGDISNGVWINNGSANFYGTLGNVRIIPDDNVLADSEFNGIDGTSFSLEGLPDVLSGNVMTLAFGNWFDSDFADAYTLAIGAIIPEPATLSLIAVGIVPIVARRRRR